MSGNKRSGRPAKPPELLKLTGQYRADRHGDRGDSAAIEGVPTIPDWLTGEGAELWNRVVPTLIKVGIATSADTETLAAMCDAWSHWLASREAVQDNPICAKARNAYCSYLSAFEKLASRFGMTAADRCRLQIEKPAKDNSVKVRKRG